MHSQSLQRVHSQQTLNEFLALLTNVTVDILEMPLTYLVEQVVLILSTEGVVALQHDIIENTEGPHVGVDGRVVYL